MSVTLANPPIIEAVVDIDCDLPPAQDLGALEVPARNALQDRYPKFRAKFVQEHKVQAPADTSLTLSVRRGLQALQFIEDDERQLVQIRATGFSFNRLAPYTSLDDYLPEIQRTWEIFVALASPLLLRQIHLRYINRIVLPLQERQVNLDDYLKTAPRLPDEERLRTLRFLDQHVVLDTESGNSVNIILASQPPEGEKQPVILDIEAVAETSGEPKDWRSIVAVVQSLRSLKNHVFQRTLTEECLKLF